MMASGASAVVDPAVYRNLDVAGWV